MKHETIPYPREFGPGNSGIDCRAVKRALAKAEHGPHGMSLKALTFAKPAQLALSEFKQAHGLLHDPVYTPQAHAKLTAFFDEYGASQMAKAANSQAAHKMRTSYVETWNWMLAHHVAQHYHQWRPIPEHLPPFETSTPINTDCSGETAITARWTLDCPDPSGLFFNGQGNTGSILHHCNWIAQAKAAPADLIVYRAGSRDLYGHHVVAILKVLDGGRDFECGSMGHEGDPGRINHSVMLASQARSGYPQPVFCRWLPMPTVALT